MNTNDELEPLRRCAVALHDAACDGCWWCCGGGVDPHDAGCKLAALITELQALGLCPQKQDQRQRSFLNLTEQPL
ncbi:MAG: hypothetical protein ACYDAG_12235 [Chloroflexota bacterium]